jgi:hypothetical protein
MRASRSSTTCSRSPTSTTQADLHAFVEAPAAFTPAGPGTALVSTPRYTLRADVGGRWASVQRIRLRPDEIGDAVEAARSFMRVTGASIGSWWISEHSTPADIETRLLTRGLAIVEGDYVIDGLLLVTPPPPGPAEVVVRAVENADEFVAALEAQADAFGAPPEQRADRAALLDEYAMSQESDVDTLFAAWLDGRIAGAGRASFSPRGAHMSGGSTAPWARGRGAYRALVRARWDAAVERGTPALAVSAGAMSAPILYGLGFERVCSFRRLEDVLAEA